MTVQEIITQVSNLLSGRVREEQLYAFFNEIELIVQTEYLGIARADAVQYTKGNGEVEPIVQGQYQRLYSYWLLSRGHFVLQNERQAERFRKLFKKNTQKNIQRIKAAITPQRVWRTRKRNMAGQT